MKKVFFLFVIVLFCNCSYQQPELKYLEGYWEIEKVKLANGSEKEYNINLTIDYFYVDETMSGYRKKVQPQLNGRFLVSEDIENFKVSKKVKQISLKYENDRIEIVKKLKPNVLVIVNDQNNTYFYKRFQKIQLPIQ